jgi:hypothetical protein
MKRTILLFLLGTTLLLGLTSCGPREYKPYALAGFCDTAQGGEYVLVSGVLKIPETILEFDRTYGVMLVEDLNQAKPFVRIGIPIGKGKNEMQTLPDGFTLADIKIQTDDGQIVTYGDTVSVSGFYGGACGAGNSEIDVMLIEAKK